MLRAHLLWYERGRVTQSCPTLCDPCSPQGSSVHGISQARILQWVAILFSRGSSWPRDWTWVSCITGRFFTVWATLIWPHPKSLHLQWLFFFFFSQIPHSEVYLRLDFNISLGRCNWTPEQLGWLKAWAHWHCWLKHLLCGLSTWLRHLMAWWLDSESGHSKRTRWEPHGHLWPSPEVT